MKRLLVLMAAVSVLFTGCAAKSTKFVTQIPNSKKVEEKIYIRTVYSDELKSIYKCPSEINKKYDYFEGEDAAVFDESLRGAVLQNNMYQEAETVKTIAEIPPNSKNILIVGVYNELVAADDEVNIIAAQVGFVLMDSEKNIKVKKEFTLLADAVFFSMSQRKTSINKAITKKVLEEINSYNNGGSGWNEKFEKFTYYNTIDEILPILPGTMSIVQKDLQQTAKSGKFGVTYTPTYNIRVKWNEEIKRVAVDFDLSKVN